MSNDKFDLEERTAKFGEVVLEFVKGFSKDDINSILIKQLVRSSTSVGANYCEADCAETRKDFEHKLGVCNKESKETKYWLRMLAKAVPTKADEARVLWKESHELNLIFVTIIKKSKINNLQNEVSNKELDIVN